jgi:hypothetical protein
LTLIEVLDLLETARKTGGFHVVAGRDAGALWIEAGACCAVEYDDARSPLADDVGVLQRVVQLGAAVVRHRDGAFRFVSNEAPPWRADTPVFLQEALGEIERQVARWEQVRKVVPSLDVSARLQEDLSVEQIVVDAERWRVLAGIGSGRSIRDLAESAGDELAVCQAVAALVEAGAVALSAPEAVRPLGRSMLAESPYGPGVEDPFDRGLSDRALSDRTLSDPSLSNQIVTSITRGA